MLIYISIIRQRSFFNCSNELLKEGKIMKDFGKFLLKGNLVPENRIPYYEQWVNQFQYPISNTEYPISN